MNDILIIGGGIIGLATARELAGRGAGKVTIVERGQCGREASWAAAGMLSAQVDARVASPLLDMALASRSMYATLAEELLEETGIDIGLDRGGTLLLAFTDEDIRHTEALYEFQSAAGLSVEMLPADEVRRAEPFASPSLLGAVRFADDCQVDTRRLVEALRRSAEARGVEIIENTAVERVTFDGQSATGVETAAGRIAAGKVVLAAGAWSSVTGLGEASMPFTVEPVRGQIVEFHTARRLFTHVIFSRRGYIAPRADGRILAGSTTEHVGFDTSVTDAGRRSISDAAAEISPSLSGLDAADQWAGLRPFAADAMPIIGEIAGIEGLTVATAHYRGGILLAPLTAGIVAERLVDGTAHQAYTVYGPDRFRFAAASEKR